MLSLLMYHIIDNRDIMSKLQQELATIMSQPHSKPKWNQLEQLPYLVSLLAVSSARSFLEIMRTLL